MHSAPGTHALNAAAVRSLRAELRADRAPAASLLSANVFASIQPPGTQTRRSRSCSGYITTRLSVDFELPPESDCQLPPIDPPSSGNALSPQHHPRVGSPRAHVKQHPRAPSPPASRCLPPPRPPTAARAHSRSASRESHSRSPRPTPDTPCAFRSCSSNFRIAGISLVWNRGEIANRQLRLSRPQNVRDLVRQLRRRLLPSARRLRALRRNRRQPSQPTQPQHCPDQPHRPHHLCACSSVLVSLRGLYRSQRASRSVNPTFTAFTKESRRRGPPRTSSACATPAGTQCPALRIAAPSPNPSPASPPDCSPCS